MHFSCLIENLYKKIITPMYEISYLNIQRIWYFKKKDNCPVQKIIN